MNTMTNPQAVSHTSGSITVLAFDLLAELPKSENLVFSPLGIYCLLAMLYEGAETDTRGAIARFISQDPKKPLAVTVHSLLAELYSRTELTADELLGIGEAEAERTALLESGEWGEEQAEFAERFYGNATADDLRLQLSVSNGMWVAECYPYRRDFAEILHAELAAEVRPLDFASDPGGACKAINDWVHDRTHGKITTVVAPEQLSPLTRLILTNTVYFKGRWQEEFSAPAPGPFYLLDGSCVEARMMKRAFWGLNWVRHDEYWAVELPYFNRPLSMVIIVPSAPGQEALHDLERGLRRNWPVVSHESSTEWQQVNLTVPEFRFTGSREISYLLRRLGLGGIFGESADFSRISDEEGFCVDQIRHDTYIAVDQHGTEATAATTAMMVGATRPPKEITLTVDRPFLFAIIDKPTGAILFFGRVTNPA